ncbi:MAG: hypothetical protein J5J06_11530 [Phycisphaerae bacterium]|nr:hypothetical protein [Phycisphaerae bacterium]
MFRRMLFWALTVSAILTASLALVSQRSAIMIVHGRGMLPSGLQELGFSRGSFVLQSTFDPTSPGSSVLGYLPDWIEVLGVSYQARSWARGAGYLQLSVSLWSVAVLLGLYPGAATLLIPFRFARRRARQQCHRCRYSLVGNTSGVCPECGEPLMAAFLPPWQRTCVALATALIVALLVEYVVQQFAIQHRIAIWFIQWFRTDNGAWLITALIRCLPVAAVSLGSYLYLSPERFPDRRP